MLSITKDIINFLSLAKNFCLRLQFTSILHSLSFLDASSHLYKRLCLSVHPSVRWLVRPLVGPFVRLLVISMLKCMKLDDFHQNNDVSKLCKHQTSISSIEQALEASSKHFKQQASISSSKQVFQASSKHLKPQATIRSSKRLKQKASI